MIEVETHTEVSLKHLVERLSPALRGSRLRWLFGIFLIVVTTAFDVISPIWVGRAVDRAVSKDVVGLVWCCKVYLVIILSKALLDSVLAYVIQSTGQKLMHALRCQLFEHILRLQVAYFDKNPTGRLLTRVMNDIKSLGELFTASISVLVLDVLVIIATMIAMLGLDWRLGGVILLTFPLVVYVILHFGGLLNNCYRRVRLELSKINAFLGENIGAIATIQRLGAESERSKKFDEIVSRHENAQMDSLKVFAKVQPFANILNGVAMASLVGFGGYWVLEGRLTLGVMVTFLGYVRNLFQPVRDLVEKYNNYLSARVSAERIGALLNEPIEDVVSGENANIAKPAKPSIEFENVDFTYPSRRAAALRNVNFTVPAHKALAVVGPTGSGKSTLVRLLLRFYEPSGGKISFEGLSISRWNLAQLRKKIGVVHQEVYLIEGTLRDNLSLGHEFPDETLMANAKLCQLWEYVKDRGGLDMKVFEGGTNLSIGERQLVAFTRILGFDPEVVVLDEATASLDRRLEGELMFAVESVLRGRTSIVIAHRLSTIRTCDRIIVLSNGCVEQSGTYEELSQQKGLFAEFIKLHDRVGEISKPQGVNL